ncbi:Stk1 family PASTA domain-containing Ser/Thr kinase [Streptomyces sp. GC420]|uniref:Stk1 family PASTA domain-containing Ser/Thr kinase n=1 Tax=Streptomyces sp. GC420 TaxID=2697568 RepID=UPI001414D191|nr:Stk1 family PASTA domain-containing Ser/Thr kinase [Streptomyces sp. GC420]NBM14906.1 Stk1 family PASTA domain-containing Ser/Thr kinase [Streptomyces sp. GC420]
MDMTLQDPLVGQVLDGRYRVDARIAVGGMATVYRAVDTRLDRILAVKVMHPSLATDATFVERFIREAKSVARLSHPNVVGVFDQGSDGAYVYLAMEYVAGCTLRDVLRERGALQPRAALDILEPVLAALGAAHRAGFVHRDMKPENVLIGDDGRVKVADFGLVRAVGTHTNTSTGGVLGTVSYLAPEQVAHGTADTRADVYACGIVLYEMLTGAKPHTGGTPAQVLYQHLNEDVPAPSAAVPGLARALDGLVATATARDPEARPYDAVALLALARQARTALSDEQLDAVPPGARAGAPAGAGPEDRTSVIPRAVATPVPARSAADDAHLLNRTSRLEMPPPGPPAAEARAGAEGARPGRLDGRRGLFAVVTALLLIVGIGAGVWYINSGQFTRVPPLLGKTEAQAGKRLSEAGLDVRGVEQAFSDSYPRGQVMASDPAQGERIRGNGSVTLIVSRGPEMVKVPDVKGGTLAEARQKLKEQGLQPGLVTKAFSEEVPRGRVISTDPAAGSERKPDTAVAILVSRGAPVEVPDVVGKSVADATAELADAGLEAEVSSEPVFSVEEKDTIAKQSPGGGAEVGEGDRIRLTVSKGPQLVEVPDVEGLSEDKAVAELEAAGFEVEVQRWFFGDTVWDQSVDGGDEAPKGSTITIKVR